MSAPGEYTDAELTVVDEGGSRLAIKYAPSWLAAVAELTEVFGFAPRITGSGTNPLGGYRTRAQQRWVSPGTSPDLSDHCKGRAVDIDNQRTFRNRDEENFTDILASHGWRNVNTSGRPFPKEPWHFANQSANPAGAGTPILIDEGEQRMRVIYNKDAPASDDDTRRAVVSDLVFKVVTAAQSLREGKLWGTTVNFTVGEWNAQMVSVEENRKQCGLGSLATTPGTGVSQEALDAATRSVLDAIAGLPSKTDIARSEANVIAAMPKTFTAN